MVKKVLFIDRDGTLIEEPADFQVDSLEKLRFYPEVITYLRKIAAETDYEIVMVTNQDGMGTASFPKEKFWAVQDYLIGLLAGEGITFAGVHIDTSFPCQGSASRKPGTGMLRGYIGNTAYDIANSYVIGDRLTDVELAKNLGCRAILLQGNPLLGVGEISSDPSALDAVTVLKTDSWKDIHAYLASDERKVTLQRKTNETDISIRLCLEGSGKSQISTGLGFFDHMLEQIARHGQIDLGITTVGDLHVDEHHTIEDTAIALGEAFSKALGNKLGIERYGFCLPMDDCLAQAAIDFGGRSWLVWDASFRREKIGDVPTELFYHFFKSFCDGAKANLNIKAEGSNEHHKIEAIFKAFAKAVRAAVRRDSDKMILPSTKGML